MTGGGRRSKKLVNSKSYLSKFLNLVKIKEIAGFRLAARGSILIEFAVCTPVLIILLYYVHDLSKVKRYYDQTAFVSQQMVNILQNISQNREDKTIRIPDIMRAASLAWLSVYPGTSMFAKGSLSYGHEFMIPMPYVIIHYIVGMPDGKASCVWGCRIFCKNAKDPYSWNVQPVFKNNLVYSHVRWGVNVDPSSIYPTLKIKEGEKKLILENSFFWNTSHVDTDGNKADSSRKAFKCYLASPDSLAPGGQMYFSSVEIFTPACDEQLFSVDPPPES